MENNITAEDLGGLLFGIHSHVAIEIPHTLKKLIKGKQWKENEDALGKIIYLEEDLLTVLKAIGLPEPVWGKSLTVKEYLKQHGKEI